MQNRHPNPRPSFITLLAGLLILRVTVAVVSHYGNYYPANFESEFLHGREPYFWGPYRWAFYAHIASGPIALVLGLLLVSDSFRLRFPAWHRRLGRIQVVCVLLVVAPSGLWIASYAAAGPIAGLGLAALAVATGSCVALGWRSAVKRQFADHRRWMWRTFLLLCSAVVLRMIGGLATVTGLATTWIDSPATWLSWLGPIMAFELIELRKRQIRRSQILSARPSRPL
jgi:hypothetical protein